MLNRRECYYLRVEEEKRMYRKRVEWMIAQKELRLHEKRKRIMIEEYEKKRAKMLKSDENKQSREYRSRRKSRSRSRSKDSYNQRRLKNEPTDHKNSKKGGVWKRLDSTIHKKPFDVEHEDTQNLDPKDLELIEVKVFQKVPAGTESTEIRRNIVNREDIILSRRDGEGKKPIFDREELKQPIEVEERRVVEVVVKSTLAKENYTKRRSSSLSPRKRRSPSPHARPSSHTTSNRHRSRHRSRSRKRSLSRDRLKSDRNHSRSRKSENYYKSNEYSKRKRRDSSSDTSYRNRRR